MLAPSGKPYGWPENGYPFPQVRRAVCAHVMLAQRVCACACVRPGAVLSFLLPPEPLTGCPTPAAPRPASTPSSHISTLNPPPPPPPAGPLLLRCGRPERVRPPPG